MEWTDQVPPKLMPQVLRSNRPTAYLASKAPSPLPSKFDLVALGNVCILSGWGTLQAYRTAAHCNCSADLRFAGVTVVELVPRDLGRSLYIAQCRIGIVTTSKSRTKSPAPTLLPLALESLGVSAVAGMLS